MLYAVVCLLLVVDLWISFPTIAFLARKNTFKHVIFFPLFIIKIYSLVFLKSVYNYVSEIKGTDIRKLMEVEKETKTIEVIITLLIPPLVTSLVSYLFYRTHFYASVQNNVTKEQDFVLYFSLYQSYEDGLSFQSV
eukprot:snap_masked-scaffold_19-processed-gene-4.17-mRNA-1 protein AED:1.00 eAED:1.00 QI:0/0/0/0/1/1/2/0/135